ncbi:MAG: hypothetical protein ACI90V_011204 [Bacillariaceae sp.]|jgi:hypothetical protein
MTNPVGTATATATSITATAEEDVLLLTLLGLLMPLRVYIFNYLGETQDELMNLTLVSKQVYTDCYRLGIDWKIIPTIEISPTKGGSTRALLQQLNRDDETNKKLRRFPRMRVNDVHGFRHILLHRLAAEIARDVRMDWILSLDISLSTQSTPIGEFVFVSLPYALSNILPNLHDVDFSNANTTYRVLENFSYRCPYLEKVTWNNIHEYSSVHLNGDDMLSCKNLKEITMDDSVFYCSNQTKDGISNLENHRNEFIFHYCCKALERVSIRNAKCSDYYDGTNINTVPQNALIKFIRNAPSTLRWFRSDLNQENIGMLQKERPGIEFLN